MSTEPGSVERVSVLVVTDASRAVTFAVSSAMESSDMGWVGLGWVTVPEFGIDLEALSWHTTSKLIFELQLSALESATPPISCPNTR